MSIKSKVLQITELAMDVTNAGIAHVIVEYMGYNNAVIVRAYPENTVYDKTLSYKARVFEVMIQLGTNNFRTVQDVHNTLDSVIDQLKALKVKEQAV